MINDRANVPNPKMMPVGTSRRQVLPIDRVSA
jgi:hypothetical protein